MKHVFAVVLCLSSSLTALIPGALVGGRDESGAGPFAFTIALESGAEGFPITGLAPGGPIFEVSLSANGVGIMGGNLHAYIVDTETNIATSITGLSPTAFLGNVVITDTGTTGLVGGSDGTDAIAYNVNVAARSATLISGISEPSESVISAVALNGSGTKGLLGGGVGPTPISMGRFAYSVDLTTNIATSIALSGTGGRVSSAAMDQNGVYGLIGIESNSPSLPAYLVDLTSTPALASAVLFPAPDPQNIQSVAINSAGTIGLLGGTSSTEEARAYIVEIASGIANATLVPIIEETNTFFNHVTLDTAGVKGILGGQMSSPSFVPIAYTIDIATNTPTKILDIPSTGFINGVAIQDSGRAGLVAGTDGTTPFLFLLPDIFSNPSQVIQLNLPAGIERIFSLSIGNIGLLSAIPTAGLRGNNLTLARYINAEAPDLASFFIPAEFDGTLSQALESVAPTRNASSLFALNNSFFALKDSISRRARDARQFSRATGYEQNELSLLASREDCYPRTIDYCPLNTLWGEVIGLDAYQSSQNETPRFHPWSVGFILGYDRLVSDWRIGGAFGYLYTHLNQSNSQGHSNINQEYLSVYSLWEGNEFYANAALWLGFFQIHNVRNIEMTGFDFRATSSPSGYQFDPHIELGYDHRFHDCEYTVEPFIMFDWAHSWQSSYNESGTGPFLFSQNSLHASMFRTELGLRFYQEFSFCFWNLVLQENFSYIYRKPYSIGSVAGFLIGAPGTLALQTFTSAQNLGSLGLTFLFDPKDPYIPAGTFGYKAELGSGYQSHQFTLGIEWGF